VSANPRTRFRPGKSGNPRGRPRTKLIREYARRIIEEKAPGKQHTIAEELVRVLVKHALRGSLGHFQQLLQLVESDTPGAGWPGANQLDQDATAKLIAKLCR
jgi:hypothetical protein